jgi:hypothetical protein
MINPEKVAQKIIKQEEIKMSKEQIQTLRELDRLTYEDYLKFKAGERIYPRLDDGKCDCCGKQKAHS